MRRDGEAFVTEEPIYEFVKGKGWVPEGNIVVFTDQGGNHCHIIKRAPVGNELYVIGALEWQMSDFKTHCEQYYWNKPAGTLYEDFHSPKDNVVTVICYGK